MKYTIIIDENREEEILIYAHEKTLLIEEIEKLILTESVELIGYKEKEIVKILLADVYCFNIENNKIYAILQNEKLQLKQRLYEVEKILDESFVKINQSCIVNIKKIERFDASFSGSLLVILKNGYKDYVSRRQLKIVKERIGLKKWRNI